MATIIAILSGGNYVDLPTPAVDGYKCIPNEISKASRNTLGNLYKYQITVKRSITINWKSLTPAQKNSILTLTKGNSFQAKYFDFEDATYKYGKFYRGSDLEVKPYPPFKNGEFKMYDITLSMSEF